ncbi:MAG: M48 family metalloprotease [Acidobacteria bacterium]|nr:M48 family metalloprotease [Acidobacteriota bacterium]
MRNLEFVLRRGRALCAGVVFLFFASAIAGAQSSCPSMVEKTKSPAGNMFTEEQEGWLGDALADFAEHQYRVIDDPAETEYLRKIGNKVVAALPPTKIKFRFYILDSGEVNGLSFAGGRIYLTRKLIASAENEDEIAGVLGHEVGHIITHQSAFEISELMRKLLHINTVGDKDDIYRKYHQLLDAEERQPRSISNNEDNDQGVADYVGLVAMANAGYAPTSYAAFWNRSFFVNNKTGNAFTDFFGVTKPSEKRLRGMKQMIATLPAGCGATTTQATAEFLKWRDSVTANHHKHSAEKPAENMSIIALHPALRMDLQRIRFSPNGKMLFAQDESSIAVFNAETGKLTFRFDADGAKEAQWSADSARIVFHTPDLHTEEWDIKQQKMLTAHEMVIKADCIQTFLSADGRTLACIEIEHESDYLGNVYFDFDLFDVATNELLLHKKAFFVTYYRNVVNWINKAIYHGYNEPIGFTVSQDGKYMVLGGGSGKLAIDLQARSEIKLTGDFKGQNTTMMAFEANGVAGVDFENPSKTGIFSFPDGSRLKSIKFSSPRIGSVSKGNFILSDGKEENELYVLDLMKESVEFKSKTRTIDITDQTFAGESTNGDIIVGTFGAGKPVVVKHSLQMPQSPLGSIRVIHMSDDGRFLALSGRSRGAVWDIKTGERMYYTLGFTAAAFSKSAVYLDVPKREKVERAIYRASLDKHEIHKVDVKLNDDLFVQSGHLMQWSTDKNRSTLTVQDIDTGKELWKRTFDKQKPPFTYNYADENLVFTWNADSPGGKLEGQQTRSIALGIARLHDKSRGLIIEVLDAATGNTLKSAVLEKPPVYSGVNGLDQVRDTVLMDTVDNRVFMFSATDGTTFKQMFGHVVGVSAEAGLFCIRNRSDEIQVYDMSGKEITHLATSSPVRFAKFDATGEKLMLLGDDQKLRMVDFTKSVTLAKKQ